MMDQGGPIQLLHNKGLVVDDRFSVVSSNNWVFASFARNRELAFVIDSPEMASFYSRAFELDWSADVSAPIADAGRDMEVHIGERVSLNGSFSSDDRAISSWTWDLYRDGTVDGREAGIEFYATSPGKHEAVLTVEDPWGNTDWDVVEFTVLPSAAPSEAAPTDSYWLLPVAGALGVLTGAALARFLRHRGRGKVNHRIGD